MKVIKKDNRCVDYDFQKIVNAVNKSANRVNVAFTDEDYKTLENEVNKEIAEFGQDTVSVEKMHTFVEKALDVVNPVVAKAYRDYRNYKHDFVHMMDSVLKSADDLNYHVDKSNANTTAALVSTKRSLIYTALNKEIYRKTFLTKEELSAIDDGYIYIHDLGARMDTYNCCLFDMGAVLKGGFEWEHIGYNEPKTLATAGHLISDITLSAASNQYGFTE